MSSDSRPHVSGTGAAPGSSEVPDAAAEMRLARQRIDLTLLEQAADLHVQAAEQHQRA